MAWTTPKTWSVGELLTASLMNTHLRDNLNAVNDVVFIAAGAMEPITGSTFGSSGQWVFLTFDAGTDESADGAAMIPTGWVTTDIILWWANGGAGAGDVRWSITRELKGDTATLGAGTTTATTITAAAASVVKKSSIVTGVSVTPGSLLAVQVLRDADNVADTLANDALVFGIELRRAS